MDAMRAAGKRRVRTNADRATTIAWYKRHFGYEEVGALAKLAEFGDPGVDSWTTLEADLVAASDQPEPASESPSSAATAGSSSATSPDSRTAASES
jgi:hypothetical protein